MALDNYQTFNREEGVKLLFGFVNALILSGIFWVVYHCISSNVSLHNSLKFSVNNSFLSIITSIFIHNSLTHLNSNILATILFGTIFFYYKGSIKGFSYFILSGIAGHLLEIVFAIPLNFLLRGYLEGLKAADLSNVGFWIMPPSGAGASGGIVGMFMIVAFELYHRFNEAYQESKDIDESKGKYNSIIYLIPFIYLVMLLLERATADFDYFCYILYNNYMKVFDPDLISVSIDFFTDIIPSSNNGNPFLAHFFGMIGGILIIIIERFQIMRNIKTFISTWKSEHNNYV